MQLTQLNPASGGLHRHEHAQHANIESDCAGRSSSIGARDASIASDRPGRSAGIRARQPNLKSDHRDYSDRRWRIAYARCRIMMDWLSPALPAVIAVVAAMLLAERRLSRLEARVELILRRLEWMEIEHEN